MKLTLNFAAALLVAASAFPISSAFADASDVDTGADLTAACAAFASGEESGSGNVSAASCKGYLIGMVTSVQQSVEAGAPLVVKRLGPKQDENYCFRLPSLLKYSEFAKLVVSYSAEHPALAERPAIELAAQTLATNYPCPK